jgi:MFS family permease
LSVSKDSNSSGTAAGPGRGSAEDARSRPEIVDPGLADAPPIDISTPLFRVRSFALLFISRLSSNSANQMMAVAVGWQVYELTGSALHLGLIGLVQFMPPLLMMLAAGQVADRYNRRLILRFCYVLEFCASAGLVVVSALPRTNISAIYILLLLNAGARTFEQPSMGSLLPIMVPRPLLSRAIAAHVSAGKLSVLVGPSLGGVLYVFGPSFVYSICSLLVLAASVASFLLPDPPVIADRPKVSWDTLLAGFRFIWRCKAVLGAMSFDLIATLFGGVNALLPIYARDILVIGPWGAGLLRSAPALGALITAAILARFPVTGAGGTFIYSGFAIFGAAVISFGLSTNVVLSILSLMVLGVGDMLSTVIRQTVVQMSTPDEMRGRVFAVNSLFLGTSGQLGSFRAGLTAAWLGAVGSVVLGGVAVFVTVAMWIWLFPALRRVDRPDLPQPH